MLFLGVRVPVALDFLANMCIFIKNACFQKTRVFHVFFMFFSSCFILFFILCSGVCIVLVGVAFLITFVFLAKMSIFMKTHGQHMIKCINAEHHKRLKKEKTCKENEAENKKKRPNARLLKITHF